MAKRRGNKSYMPLNSSPTPSLRRIRHGAGLTQQQLSTASGVAVEVIRRGENGGSVSLSSRRRLAQALGLPAGELVLQRR